MTVVALVGFDDDLGHEIVEGYRYEDYDNQNVAILRILSDGIWSSVVDSRVDTYTLHGKFLHVARRPREYSRDEDDGVLSHYFATRCEIWRVDIESHEIQLMDSRYDLTGPCRLPAGIVPEAELATTKSYTRLW